MKRIKEYQSFSVYTLKDGYSIYETLTKFSMTKALDTVKGGDDWSVLISENCIM